MGDAITPAVERRSAPRWSGAALSGIESARIRPGRDVALVNLSVGGALVETSGRLLPGARVVMQLRGPDAALAIHGTVLRCQVHALRGDGGVRYRGAVAFETGLDAGACGYLMPTAGPAGE